ncbi:MAG: class I SAM-dependent methyltransferase [Spirochaetaceae bacterium]|nr:class I SAM-dependent methyltransferase [Spirochaetaceae bacterium]
MIPVALLRLFGLFGKGMRVLDKQRVRVADVFRDGERILDLGSGGEGVIGRLRKRQVVAVDLVKNELDETPEGPEKVVADARALPFADGSFDAAAAFFFLMYLKRADRALVLKEAHRVLKPGGLLHVWDAEIPDKGGARRRLFVVPLVIDLPEARIETAYGVPWADHALDRAELEALGVDAGFDVTEKSADGRVFHLALKKR